MIHSTPSFDSLFEDIAAICDAQEESPYPTVNNEDYLQFKALEEEHFQKIKVAIGLGAY